MAGFLAFRVITPLLPAFQVQRLMICKHSVIDLNLKLSHFFEPFCHLSISPYLFICQFLGLNREIALVLEWTQCLKDYISSSSQYKIKHTAVTGQVSQLHLVFKKMQSSCGNLNFDGSSSNKITFY